MAQSFALRLASFGLCTAALLGVSFADAAQELRWGPVQTTFTQTTGGINSGPGSNYVEWGNPSNGSAEIFADSVTYFGPVPPTFSVLLTYRNGAQFVGTSLTSGAFMVRITGCWVDSRTSPLCWFDMDAVASKEFYFDVINTLNTGDPVGDSDALRFFGVGTAWVPEGKTASFRAVLKPRLNKAARYGAPGSMTLDMVDIEPLSPGAFVTSGDLPVPDRVLMDVQVLKNEINAGSNGALTFAVLGRDGFIPLDIDLTSIKLGPGQAAPFHLGIDDVNGDGTPDVIVKFHTRAAGISCMDTLVKLEAKTSNGMTAARWVDLVPKPCD